MNRKLNIVIIAINFTTCSCAPFIPPKIENQRPFDLSATQIIDMLGKSLPIFLEATSSKTPKIEVKKVQASPGKPGVALIITNYKPNDSSFTECTIANNGGWANIWNGLDHGVIGIVLTPMGSKATYVEINSGFHENYSVRVPGEVVGYVGGYAVQGTDWVDKGSHCYSTGIIERSIFDLIQSKVVAAKAEIAPTISSKNEVEKLKNNTLEGKKTMTLPDGSKFDGELKNGKLEGQGTMTSPDGRKFVGEFKNGIPEGQATFILPNGTQKEVTFKNGELVQ